MPFSKLTPPLQKEFSKTDFSKLIREDCEMNWNILLQEFLNCKEKRTTKSYMTSPEFPLDSKADFKWTIRLYPNGTKTDEIPKYSSVYLFLVWKKIHCDVSIVASISMLTRFHSYEHEMEYKCTKNRFGYGYPKFIRLSELESDLRVESASILVKVSAMYDANCCYTSNFYSERILQDDYIKLLKDGTYSDITIRTSDNAEFKSHRNILSARSKVFAVMLSYQMTESLTGTIEIKDCSRSTMENLLNFIYGCKVQFSSVNATMELLNASEKYDLLDLKHQCSEYLSSIINEKNACKIFVLADDYDLSNVKTNVFQYMRRNKRKFSTPDAYEHILKKKPRLLAEITAKFIEEDDLD